MGKIALVSGANGVTGSAVVNALSAKPKSEWSKIYAMSRSPPQLLPKGDDRIEFIGADFTQTVQDIIALLQSKGVNDVTHFFFYSYIHSYDAQLQWDNDVPLFENALKAVDATSPNLERVVLQTGAKHYGVHFEEPTSFPITEHFGRKDYGPPNFYYGQEDAMFELQKQNKKWTWNVIRPWCINGFTKGNGMSWATTVALYFSLQAYLGAEAVFPGSSILYNNRQHMSSATCIAEFSLFMATNPKAANEAFNIVDGVDTTFRDVWEYLGQLFGVKVVVGEHKETLEFYTKDKSPLWHELCRTHGGNENAWNWATWDFVDGICMRDFPADVSMEKAKQFGWTRTFDTKEELKKIVLAMQSENALPDIK